MVSALVARSRFKTNDTRPYQRRVTLWGDCGVLRRGDLRPSNVHFELSRIVHSVPPRPADDSGRRDAGAPGAVTEL